MAGPEARIPLGLHARIAAEIAEGSRPVADVLAAHGLDEATWHEASLHWHRAMGDEAEARRGAAELAPRYAKAFADAQDALSPRVDLTPEAWAELVSEVRDAGELLGPLERRGLKPADYLRLQRFFAELVASDPEVAARFYRAYERLER